MKLLRAIALVALIAGIAGCEGSSFEIPPLTKAWKRFEAWQAEKPDPNPVDTLMRQMLSQAMAMPGAEKRLQAIGRAQNDARALALPRRICGAGGRIEMDCLNVPAYQMSLELRQGILQELAEGGDFLAIQLSWETMSAERRADLLQQEMAAAAKPGYPGPRMQWLAEQIYSGTAVMRDTQLAYSRMGRAWRAGAATAADRAGMMALSAGDLGSAYFWSLRCTAPDCTRSAAMDLDQLGQSIKLSVRLQAEKVARDRSVIAFTPSEHESPDEVSL